MKYAALDFEVGNANMTSACAIGLCVFEDFRMVRRFGCLIRPPKSAGKFHWGNVRVNGIKKKDVRNAPTFGQLWDGLREDLENSILVCHNAAFDTAVLRACLDYFGLPYPRCRYLCTVKVAQAVWPEMENHRLNTLSEALGIKLDHHEAGSDAHAAGLLLLEALRATGCADAVEMAEKLGLRLGVLGGADCKTAQEIEREEYRLSHPRRPRRRHCVKNPELQTIEITGKGEHHEKRLFERTAKH